MASTHGSNLYEAIGGRDTCRRLSVAFYARVERDPLLRPLFPGKTFTCAIEELSAFLAQCFGGPSEDMQRRWWLSLRESHLRFKIGQMHRDAWVANMVSALRDVQIAEPMRRQLLAFFERSSAYIVNQEEAVAPDEGRLEARRNRTRQEISRRWDAQLRLDEAVAAIRSGDANRAIALAEDPALKNHNPSVISGLLGLMVRSRQSVMLGYVRAKLTTCPILAHQRHAGRTLLHEAAAAGSSTTVELLLDLGADPDTPDSGGHTPLYCVGNECAFEGAGEVVRALVRAAADVNAHDGVKHCTPLHMAARRGNVEVGGALLDSGANIEARDSHGDTPLRRAVNCDRIGMAALLLARGADIDSVGSKGLTPRLAARTITMKRLLQMEGGQSCLQPPF
jgi:truncated hemoglobin YjbI